MVANRQEQQTRYQGVLDVMEGNFHKGLKTLLVAGFLYPKFFRHIYQISLSLYMNKQILVAISAVVLAGVGVGGWMFFSKSQSSISGQPVTEVAGDNTGKEKQLSPVEKITARSFAENILALIQSRDYGKVYDLLREEDKAKVGREEYIKNVIEKTGNLSITKWEVKEVLEKENGADIQYVAETTNPLSPSETGLLSLVKKDGKWYFAITEDSTTVERKIGDEVELATLKFTVNSSQETQKLTKYGKPIFAKIGAKFVVLKMSVTNTTKETNTFSPDGFAIIDDKERQFAPYGDIFSVVDNYLNMRTMAPSIAETGVMMFEIPEDAKNYSLSIGKSGTDELYKVILK